MLLFLRVVGSFFSKPSIVICLDRLHHWLQFAWVCISETYCLQVHFLLWYVGLTMVKTKTHIWNKEVLDARTWVNNSMQIIAKKQLCSSIVASRFRIFLQFYHWLQAHLTTGKLVCISAIWVFRNNYLFGMAWSLSKTMSMKVLSTSDNGVEHWTNGFCFKCVFLEPCKRLVQATLQWSSVKRVCASETWLQ